MACQKHLESRQFPACIRLHNQIALPVCPRHRRKSREVREGTASPDASPSHERLGKQLMRLGRQDR